MRPRTIDLRGLRCPLPVLRTRKALRGLSPGTIVVVECTDPLAGIDIPHLVAQSGDELMHTAQANGVLSFMIRKAG